METYIFATHDNSASIMVSAKAFKNIQHAKEIADLHNVKLRGKFNMHLGFLISATMQPKKIPHPVN